MTSPSRSWLTLPNALEVSAQSLRIWMRQSPQAGFRPMEVVERPGAHSVHGLKLTTPEGISIEGLSVQAAIELCEALR